jgi:hypothetical protein
MLSKLNLSSISKQAICRLFTHATHHDPVNINLILGFLGNDRIARKIFVIAGLHTILWFPFPGVEKKKKIHEEDKSAENFPLRIKMKQRKRMSIKEKYVLDLPGLIELCTFL